MEEFAVLVFLLVVAGAGWGLWASAAAKREHKRIRNARWEATSQVEGSGDNTIVLVHRVYHDRHGAPCELERVRIASLSGTRAPSAGGGGDWDTMYHETMAEARQNAAARNSERSP